MKRSLKILFLSLLIAVLYIANGDVSVRDDFSTESTTIISQKEPVCSFENTKTRTFSDVELGGTGVQLNEATSHTQPVQINKYIFSSQDSKKELSKCETGLYKHSIKLYNASFLSSVIHPVSEYYVFALRHIII